MEAGSLRHQIEIEKETMTPNLLGGQNKTWECFATVWAAIEPLSGRELLIGHQSEPEITTRITIRYLSGLETSMRIKKLNDDGETYTFFKIEYILNEYFKNRMITIMGYETKDYEGDDG